MSRYSVAFKANMVRKMAGGISACALSKEVEIPQSTLSRWLREAGRPKDIRETPTRSRTMREERPKRPQDWSPEEKVAAVLEAAAVPDAELGAYLRREGLHQSELAEWRRRMVRGLEKGKAAPRRGQSPEARRVRELERELRRKEAALAETAALLVLEKKVRTIWADGDDATPSRRGK